MSKFKDVTTEALKGQSAEAQTRFAALIEAAGDSPTVEQVNEAQALATEIDEMEAEITARTEAATSFEALRNRTFGSNSDPERSEEAEAAGQGDGEVQENEDGTVSGDTSPGPVQEEPVVETRTTEAASKPKSVKQFAKNVKRPAAPEQKNSGVMIRAAADVPTFAAGAEMDGIEAIARAAVERMRGFTPPSGDGKSVNLQKFGLATMRLPFENEFVIDRGTDDMEVLYRAANERRLEGESLTAAGGWCSPSETLYDLAGDESAEGLLSLPEVQVRRGGIRYTTGPQFADFYANAGFVMTEAQAIAGNTKPCYDIACPSFTDVRLDAVGLCLRVNILQNAAYPELTNRFVSGTMIAHQHMVNANVIGRLVTASGSARVITGLGSTVSDTMEGLELLADQRRQTYRLPLNRTLEVVVPFWLKGAMRSDLARRNGVAAEAITDAQIDAHFRARNLNVQYVYDWQLLPVVDDAGTAGVNEANTYPATYQALMYPAGTFVKGVSDVINLNAVYDAASLATNTYTGLFMEQGLLVAKMQYGSDLLTLPVCNAGRTGASDLTCA